MTPKNKGYVSTESRETPAPGALGEPEPTLEEAVKLLRRWTRMDANIYVPTRKFLRRYALSVMRGENNGRPR